MFAIDKYCNQELSLGNCVAIMPSLGIFSVSGVLLQENTIFAHSDSITGLDSILDTIHFVEPQDNIEDNGDGVESIIISGSDVGAYISSLTGINRRIFEVSDLAVISFKVDEFEQYENYQKDMSLLESLSDKAFNALNLLRFTNCNLFVPDLLPWITGYWYNSDGYLGACVMSPHSKARVIAGRVMGGAVSNGLGMGIEASDTLDMEYNSFTAGIYSEHGEVGEVISRSLKIYSRAMYANSQTMKFINIMALFEYLGTGDKYTNFKQVRPKLQAHIAKSRPEYDDLTDMFKKFTSLQENGVVFSRVCLAQAVKYHIPNTFE